MMRTNRTFKVVKVGLKKDNFTFEDGIYYINSDRIFLMKRWFRYKPILIFKEGVSQPIGFYDIIKRKVMKMVKVIDEDTGKPKTDKEGNEIEIEKEIEDDTVLIDARTLHKLASEFVLGFLTKSRAKTLLTIAIILIFINLLISIGGVIN